MMPGRHAAMSFGIGLLGWWWSGSPTTLPVSVLVGTLIDLDHMADYAWYAQRDEHRLILPLHGYELVLLLWWAARRLPGQRAAIPIVVSYVLHLLSDELENQTKPGAYSLIWRMLNGFRLEALSRDPQAAIQGREDDLHGLRQLVSQVRIL